ncbi:PREDICTED: receptor-type tyrosine-protein phosphatase N2-like [Galeopterus variegatus]|uniref:Receptor-type tyrosine-protein phosphatase N2-like n=1 Tax=Galeopterus variegatus TaxID=482537 RepID=A0ABM0RMZ6_GALVR|nr:PREDICTED: receptor-type tyrosine-protein phosphatase N2-like [Galeopterus variegatus]
MANAIADVVQGVDPEGGQDSPGREAGGDPGEQTDSLQAAHPGDGVPDDGEREEDDRVHDQVSRLSIRLGDLLRDHGSQLPPGAPPLAKSFKTEIKKAEDPEASLPSEEEGAGVENVKSRSYSTDSLERKLDSEPRVGGLGEFQNWIQGALREEQSRQAGAGEPAGQGLQLEVKSPEEEEFGYIVTELDPLSPEAARQLTEDVARLARVPASAFVDVGVLGPAVTFKVSANVQNVTTADVAKAAGEETQTRTAGGGHQQDGPGSVIIPQQQAVHSSAKFCRCQRGHEQNVIPRTEARSERLRLTACLSLLLERGPEPGCPRTAQEFVGTPATDTLVVLALVTERKRTPGTRRSLSSDLHLPAMCVAAAAFGSER